MLSAYVPFDNATTSDGRVVLKDLIEFAKETMDEDCLK